MKKIRMKSLDTFIIMFKHLYDSKQLYNWAIPSLGDTIKKHLKEWLKNQKWPNHFLGPFPLHVFTTINQLTIFKCIACLNIWFEVYFEIKKIKIIKKLYF